MRSFYAPPPLIVGITDFNVSACAAENVAKIGDTQYASLQAALTAAKGGDTVTLLQNIDTSNNNPNPTTTDSTANANDNLTGSYIYLVKESITLDGNGFTITNKNDTEKVHVICIKGDENSKIDVTVKNLTVKGDNGNGRCIFTYGNVNSLNLDTVKLFMGNTASVNVTRPFVISAPANSTTAQKITITNCEFQSDYTSTQSGYAITSYTPAEVTIADTKLGGWACLYIKKASDGITFNLDNCELNSVNLKKGNTNGFGCIVLENTNSTVNVTNTKIDVKGTENDQGLVCFNIDYADCTGSVVTLGAGNTINIEDKYAVLCRNGSDKTPPETNKHGTLIITGGTFNTDPSGYVDKTKYIVITKDSSYTVKELITNAVVSADNKSKVYGATDPTLTASLVNISDDDKSLVKYTISRAAGDDAGTYAITVTGDATQGDATANYYQNITYKNGTFTITKAESSLTKAPAAVSGLAYTGSAQALVTAGTATGGTIQYVLGTDSTTAPTSGFKADIPTGTDAATYYVWYKVAGDKNHNDTTPVCITVSIANAGSSIADQSITVTKGTTTTLAVKDSSGSGTRTWALSNGAPSWVTLKKDSDEQATLTIAPDLEVNADTYICSVTVTNADNNTATGKVSITVEPTVDYALADMSEEEKEAITDLDELLTPEQKVELTDSQLEKIVEELPNLAKVDLSGAVNLTKVDMKGSTSLTTINFEGCTSLTKVNLGGCNSLTSIGGLKNNTSITEVDTSACSSLESLDVSGCTSLTSLDCSAGSIGTLNVTGCDSLAYLDCSGNKLEKLEVSSPALEDLNCGSNGLLNMDVKNSFKLKNLNCRGNSMAALDIDASKFTALETIDCSGQEISELSVTEESGYQVVDIWGYIAKFFARLFSGSTSSTVTISLNADTAAELSNIADVKAYGEDGREIISNYDASTGVVNLSEVPSRVSYKYKTGYENVSMDVSIGETITPEEHDTTLGNSSGSGGCSAGYGIFSVSALLLMFAMFTARKHS